MTEMLHGMAALLAIVALVFLFVVAPIWILCRYVAKKRAGAALVEDERSELRRLAESEAAMRERIANLEAILDAETPHWRRADD